MKEKILVCVAWPYASSSIHVGNMAGADLPPDIYARYHRLKGNDVLMVSGSDSHGTPTTVRADQEGISPREVFERFHAEFLETFQKMGLAYDLFTHTDTENHHRVAQNLFLRLLENGYLYTKTEKHPYSLTEGRFLPDRYVEGTCPHCGYDGARGDQCENCGKLLDAIELINPRSRNDGSRPEIRDTTQYFLDLPALADRLIAWLDDDKEHWRPNVINFSRNMARDLQGRAITRDLAWGIPVPVKGWEGKSIYVWFEAVIGYLSASVEWAKNTGRPEAWKEWWYNSARIVYFIGKDNIPFHTVMWPATLIGAERLHKDDDGRRFNLPYDVPANEFLNMESRKVSGSRGWAVWVLDFLSRYDADALRYYLTANAPETRDTDFTWEGFVRRNNDELVAAWGNLANRVLSFAYKRFDKCVPQPGDLDESDQEILAKVEAGFESVGALIETCKFRAALGEVMALTREVNRYLDGKAPWFQIKEDRAAAATTVYTALRAIDSLKILFTPFLPFSSQLLHETLGYEGSLFGRQYLTTFEEETRSHQALCYDASTLTEGWEPSQLPPGQTLRKPEPLFKKLDESIIEEELARMAGG
ncbi:MAG: methionine--tRNA ligase [Anaerolineaceae bacterium 4572_32.2]|nr:MAG: methionine--tRNA ligase [Anaerolineaceae bacterium 4572_32.2]